MAANLRDYGTQHCCQTCMLWESRCAAGLAAQVVAGPVELERSHARTQYIDPHVDYADTYSSLDPIVSLSFGRGGVLTLGPKKGGQPTKMLFQENGDALVMAGAFQSEFVHGVPKRGIWSNLQLHPMYNSLRDWEKRGLASEIEMHEAAAPGAKHVRMNCTIRWHDTHYTLCPAIRGSKPAVAGEDQLPDPWAVDEPLYPVVGAASSGQFAGIKLSECAGAEQVQADTNVAPSSSGQFTGINLSERAGAEQVQADTNVAAASSGQFAGIKLSELAGAEQVQAVDHGCENLHENMIVRLSDVLAPHLGLVKDKMAMVVKVDLHHEDQERLRHREAGFWHFVPEYMAKGIWVKLLKGKSSPMEDALLETWEGQFENVADHTDDAKTLFFVELMHADFKIDLKIGEENEKIEARWQFPLLHGMLRTAYSAQGLTLDGGVLVDLRRAGGLEDDDWWLAIYVMLTHARKLENLILLGMTAQVEDLLRRGPPAYLRELTDKLEAKGASTLERLQNWPLYDSVQTSWHHTLHLDSTACRRSDLLE